MERMSDAVPGTLVVLVSISGWSGHTATIARIKSVTKATKDDSVCEVVLENGEKFHSNGRWEMSGKAFDADYEIIPLVKSWKPISSLSEIEL